MATKRLFSLDKRAEAILSSLKNKNENLSGFVSNAVVDELLPVYSSLRTEALYLLDFVIDGAKDWKGGKLIIATGEDEVQFYSRQVLSRGVEWLKHHHIRKSDILRDALARFNQSAWNGGVRTEDLSDGVKKRIERTRAKLIEVNPSYPNFYVGLGSLARDVLDHWDLLWDWDGSYEIIADAIYCEKPFEELDPYKVILMLQIMESSFILDAIGDFL